MRLFRLLMCLVVLLALGLPLGEAPAQAATAAITLSPDTGREGTAVTITGSGFPKKKSGTVTAGSSSASFAANASGYFTVELTIPATSEPTVTVRAAAATVSASAIFTVVHDSPLVSPKVPGGAGLRFGVGTPGGPLGAAELEEVAALTGEAPSIILSYKDFNQPPPLTELEAVRARGAQSLLTWEPWTWGGGVSQPAYSLDRISAGDFDPYLRHWGEALASWGHPVMLRFGHEMNGDWYPWSEQVNGNSPGDYISAWRHVHDVVSSASASNITWVWNPNVPYWESAPLTGLYPGADYVDAVALDGYNWGTATSWSSWTSPSQLFEDGLSQLRNLAPGKQILIAETSSAEQGGSKAEWNTALITYLASQSDVTAVIWFHFNKEADWRINSSTASAQALKQALSSRS